MMYSAVRKDAVHRNKGFFWMSRFVGKSGRRGYEGKEKMRNDGGNVVPFLEYLPMVKGQRGENEKNESYMEYQCESEVSKYKNMELPKIIKLVSPCQQRRNSHFNKIPLTVFHKQQIEITKNSTPIQSHSITKTAYYTPLPINTTTKHNFIISSLSLKGTKQLNQDVLLIQDNIFHINDFIILSVFDGHGPNGHFISNLAKSKFIQHFLTDSTLYYIPRSPSPNVKSLKKYITPSILLPKLCSNNYKVITSVYTKIQNDIKHNNEFDTHFSGTTSCSVFIIGNTVICSNIGDSRAIVVSGCNGGEWKELSKDHKAEVMEERNRIMNMGGEVRNVKGVMRVYRKGEDYPGLAMSRSLGDLVAKDVGVSAEAEVMRRELMEEDIGVVVASDGLWEYVGNDEVVRMVMRNRNNGEEVIKEMVDMAKRRFLEKGDYVDDISVILMLRKM